MTNWLTGMSTPRMTRSEPLAAALMAGPPPNWANWIWLETMAAATLVAPGMICTATSRPFFWKMPVSAAMYRGQNPGEATLYATEILVAPAAPEAGAEAAALPAGLAEAL